MGSRISVQHMAIPTEQISPANGIPIKITYAIFNIRPANLKHAQKKRHITANESNIISLPPQLYYLI